MTQLDLTRGLAMVRAARERSRSAGNAAAIGTIRGVLDVLGEPDAQEAVRLIRQVLDAALFPKEEK